MRIATIPKKDSLAHWCIIDDLGIVDRYFTRREAREAMKELGLDNVNVEYVEDPGEL